MLDQQMNELVQTQRDFYNTGATRSLDFRMKSLRRLKTVMTEREQDLLDALLADLAKSPVESYSTEIGACLGEIDYFIKHLRTWIKNRPVKGSLAAPLARCHLQPEPLGVALISSPWNYPIYLAIMPLIGAIAAGNCAIVKPSHFAPQCSQVLARIVREAFEPGHVHVAEGDTDTSTALLKQHFDYIFFTGSTSVGRIVMKAAADHLTPVTLELGGKSPCIIDKSADLKLAARRTAWGKFINAGQTCIAPDYLLVHCDIKNVLMAQMAENIAAFYGPDPRQSRDYGRIVSPRHFIRLEGFLKDGRIITGGESDLDSLYIAPTIMDQVDCSSPVMQEEIFGPILPVIEYEDLEEVLQVINQRPRPLALYLFSDDPAIQDQVLNGTSSGGVSINDTLSHILPHQLPFGGVDDSGMGAYHGRSSFDTFSHMKSVLKASKWPDLAFKYPPYKISLDMLKRIMRYV